MTGRRSRAREAALKILYQLDITKDPPEEGLAIFLKNHRVPVSSRAFLEALVRGTAGHLAEIDSLLSKYATNWSLNRMAVVDRNILRLAAFELLFGNETPPKVAINEAVELAKRFGSPDSSKFVNGVLDSLHKAQKPQPEQVQGEPAAPS
ncbi:MAG: transcription antitermination factor NusB [Candidatus Omnitrophica bacterium]|nr:transcription antitermination factor NusB [Candidatus Omnitrophota bacterium]